MKRLLAILGVFALLGTLFVVATASPSAADTAGWTAENDGTTGTILVTAVPAVGDTVTWKVGPSSTVGKKLQTGVKYTITASDADGKCLVNGGSVETIYDKGAWDPYEMWTWSVDTKTCATTNKIRIDKNVDHELDRHAGELMTWEYTITAVKWPSLAADTSACAGSNTTATVVGIPDGDAEETNVTVLNGYPVAGKIFPCVYQVTENVPTGWTLDHIDFHTNSYCGDQIIDPEHSSDSLPTHDEDAATAWVMVQGASEDCEVNFDNTLDHIPLTVTKTFTGREYYTTVDRADFHIYTPGLCGALPIDPFGGLVGNVGIYRTINASQQTQVVAWLPDTLAAGGHGPCTYRVQENNAPEGCVAVNPSGSDADGPYWEKTWKPGKTTAFNFNIVNDCAEVVPDPTPDPTVAPTTAPKKPGTPGAKKPSGGGSAAPKFTG